MNALTRFPLGEVVGDGVEKKWGHAVDSTQEHKLPVDIVCKCCASKTAWRYNGPQALGCYPDAGFTIPLCKECWETHYRTGRLLWRVTIWIPPYGKKTTERVYLVLAAESVVAERLALAALLREKPDVDIANCQAFTSTGPLVQFITERKRS